MAENDAPTESQSPPGPAGDSNGESSSSGSSGGPSVINHMMANKVEAAMWISRIMTLLFTVSFVLPIFG